MSELGYEQAMNGVMRVRVPPTPLPIAGELVGSTGTLAPGDIHKTGVVVQTCSRRRVS